MAQRWIAIPALTLACVACTPFETREVQDAPLDVLAAEQIAPAIGTAFALDDGTYVTAAHVFDALIGSGYPRPVLLDARSALHSVENVVRYSSEEDFVVFTAKSMGRTLADRRASTDRAAAERLTKAVRGPAGAQADIRVQPVLYALNLFQYRDLLGSTESTVFAPEFFSPEESVRATQSRAHMISLEEPLSYERFAAQVVAARNAYFSATLNRWLRTSERSALLGGTFAAPACELLHGAACPTHDAGDNDVVLKAGEPTVLAQTPTAPTLQTMWLDGVLVLHRKTSREAQVNTVFSMEGAGMSPQRLALIAVKRWRDRVESRELVLGDPVSTYTDLQGGAWELRTWFVIHQDLKLIALARPIAGGYIALLTLVPTSLVHASTLHLQILANVDAVASDTHKAPAR